MEQRLLHALDVIEMLEEPVVAAYGRETFKRLLYYPSHMLIHAHEEEDTEILEWCVKLLRRKGIYVFYEVEKTRRGQTICRLVAGEAGELYGKVCHYQDLSFWAQDIMRQHKGELSPEAEAAIEEFVETMRDYIEKEVLLYCLEYEYNDKIAGRRYLRGCCDEIKEFMKYAEECWQKVVQLLPEHIKATLNTKER
jgi:hypothetical protein